MSKNEELTNARKAKGYTQEELAVMLGYKKGTISNWENGYSKPSITDAFKIANILERDIYILFSGNKVQESCTKKRSLA